MTIELIKQLLDACYLAKRAREMLPALPEGVTSSYIQCLDVIQKLQTRGIQPKISDLSDTLNLPRPGVTRTVKEMEHKGYLRKQVSAEDGRVTYLFLTESGQALSQKYNTDYFSQLLPYLDSISEEDAACTIQTLEKFYAIIPASCFVSSCSSSGDSGSAFPPIFPPCWRISSPNISARSVRFPSKSTLRIVPYRLYIS